MDAEEQKQWNEKLKKMTEHELLCDHIGNPSFGAQQVFEDNTKGCMVLITTIMCGKCGHLFFDTQDTSIKATLKIIDPNSFIKSEEVEKNGRSN